MRIVAMIAVGAMAWAQDAGQMEKSKQMLDKMQQAMTFVSGQIFNSNPVKGQPYSGEAVSETTQTLADGNKIVQRSTTMVYRDSDGRERREESVVPGGSSGAPAKVPIVVFISDPVAKMSFTLHPVSKTAERNAAPATMSFQSGINQVTTEERVVTIRSSSAGAGNLAIAEPDFMAIGHADAARAGKTEQLGTQTIEGVVAEGTRTTTTIPAGQIGNERDINIVSERWFSKDLGVLVMSKRSDPRMGETVYRLTNVNRSEPPHSLFEIPPDYTVSEGSMGRKVLTIQKDEQ